MCKNTAVSARLAAFRERRPFKVVAVALAHKMARIVWALMAKGGAYRAAVPAATESFALTERSDTDLALGDDLRKKIGH